MRNKLQKSALIMLKASRLGQIGLPTIGLLLVAVGQVPAQAQVLMEKQISMAIAQEIAAAAVDKCQKDGFKVTATVVDRNGRIKAMLRADGTNPQTIEASQRKAYTAAMFRTTTDAFAERVSKPASAALTQLDGVIALRGGVPIKAGDDVIGAIGVGGAPGGDKDEVCSNAGIQKVIERLR
jgi:uncharacterized protein GlcG (DUF336 family)